MSFPTVLDTLSFSFTHSLHLSFYVPDPLPTSPKTDTLTAILAHTKYTLVAEGMGGAGDHFRTSCYATLFFIVYTWTLLRCKTRQSVAPFFFVSFFISPSPSLSLSHFLSLFLYSFLSLSLSFFFLSFYTLFLDSSGERPGNRPESTS